MTFRAHILRFWRDERGLALVELAFGIPFVMLVLFLTIEGGRLFFAYQSVIQGVRDASRYVARVVPTTVCPGGDADISGMVTGVPIETLVARNANAGEAFPIGMRVTDIAVTRLCVGSEGDYSLDSVPVAQVSATLEIEFPFSGIASVAAGRDLGSITTIVSDQSRIYGL